MHTVLLLAAAIDITKYSTTALDLPHAGVHPTCNASAWQLCLGGHLQLRARLESEAKLSHLCMCRTLASSCTC